MACGQAVCTQGQGRIQQRAELNGAVATGAGVGRAPGGIGGGKGHEHLARKGLAQINHMQGHVQGGTGPVQPQRRVFRPLGQKTPVQGQHLVPRATQQEQGAQAVHPAAHGYSHGLHCFCRMRVHTLTKGSQCGEGRYARAVNE